MSFEISKNEFLESIRQKMDTYDVSKENQTQLKQEAASIFEKFDTIKKDENWDSQENRNATSTVSQFVMKLAEAASDAFGITAKAPEKSDNTPTPPNIDVTGAYTAAMTKATGDTGADIPFVSPETENVASNFSKLTPEEQITAIKQEIADIYASGGSIINFDGETITILRNDETKEISLSQLGLNEADINNVKYTIEEIFNESILAENGMTIESLKAQGYTDFDIKTTVQRLSIKKIADVKKATEAEYEKARSALELTEKPKHYNAEERFLNSLENIESKYSQYGEISNVESERRTINGQEMNVIKITFENGKEVLLDGTQYKEIEQQAE